MKYIILIPAIFISLNSFPQIKNFMFIGMDREQLTDTNRWASNGLFEGVQVAYSWRQIEHERDEYDFEIIKEDLKLLKKYGKKLFIQIQDVSFSMKWNHAPAYILNDTIYHGGANKQYKFRDIKETDHYELGWVTRRWDTAVQKRLHKLYMALGKEFDGIVEGINTEETSVTFGNGPLYPPGFTPQRYKFAIMENLMALKKAFPRSTVIVYANFMPGGYMPGEDTTLLKDIYEFAGENGIGVGGPDLLPYKPGQMSNSYGFIRNSYKKGPTGVAVQDGTNTYISPQTNKMITAREIYQFAQDYLRLTYIFWGTEDPFFHQETIPFLQSLKQRQN
jgi:hypothetical protein